MSVKLRRYFDVYIPRCRVPNLQASTILTKYLQIIPNISLYCAHCLMIIIAPRVTCGLESS